MSSAYLDTLIPAFHDVISTRYFGVSAFVLTIYDWILLFDDEIELVGKSRLCLGKVLYYFTRILTPIGLALGLFQLSELRGDLSREFCVIFTFICPTLECVSLLASYWLLMLRLVALYKSKPWVVWLLYGTLFASYIATLGLLIQAEIYFKDAIVYVPAFGICATTGRAPTIAGIFYAPFGFELLLFTLTLWHAWKDYRSQSESSTIPLLRVLYRDGVLLFVVMAAVRLWNILIFASQPLTRTYLGIYMMWAIITVLSNRIYLNMVAIARYNAKDRLPSPQTPTHSAPWQGHFPRVIGRPIPPSVPRSPTLRTMNSEMFYSAYFEDQFALEHLTLEAPTPTDVPGSIRREEI